jgi:2-dehydro-3-deoxygalactonokinase
VRFIIADWGTSRLRVYLVEDGRILDRVASDEGVSALRPGEHRAVFRRQAAPFLEAEPDAAVALVGMVGSREGWVVAPYAPCPAGPEDVRLALIEVDLGDGRKGHVVPGLIAEPAPGATDVMRGEETLAFGAGAADGLVCLPGTHSKWVALKGGRIMGFSSYMTGELYALLRQHSMIGRPATEPSDPAGFDLGLAAAERNGTGGSRRHGAGLTHLLFGARAATVAGRLPPERLGPYLSGLLTGDEVAAALATFGDPEAVTVVADPPRSDLYVATLRRHGVEVTVREPEECLVAGLARILRAS